MNRTRALCAARLLTACLPLAAADSAVPLRMTRAAVPWEIALDNYASGDTLTASTAVQTKPCFRGPWQISTVPLKSEQ